MLQEEGGYAADAETVVGEGNSPHCGCGSGSPHSSCGNGRGVVIGVMVAAGGDCTTGGAAHASHMALQWNTAPPCLGLYPAHRKPHGLDLAWGTRQI